MLKKSYKSAQYVNSDNSLTYAYGKMNAIIIDDVDKNGYIDLVTFPSNFSTIPELYPLVWLNNKGIFNPSSSFINQAGTYQYFRDAVPGDFNNDGLNDYFMLDQGFEFNRTNATGTEFRGNTPSLIVGTRNGLLWQDSDQFLINSGNGISFNHIGDAADFDQDGDLDVIDAAFWSLRLYENIGNNKFTWREDLTPSQFNDGTPWYETENNPTFAASGATFIKFGDSYALAIGAYRQFSLSDKKSSPVILEWINDKFEQTQILSRPPVGDLRKLNYGVSDMYNYDINNDGLEDLIITWETENIGGIDDGLSNTSGIGGQSRYTDISDTVVAIFFQNEQHQLVEDTKNSIYSLAGTSSGAGLIFKDYNGDGLIDFSSSTYGIEPSRLNELMFLNDGTGHFYNPEKSFFQLSENFESWYKFSPFFVDVNNDSILDVVAVRGVFPEPPIRHIGEELIILTGANTSIIGDMKNNLLDGTKANEKIYGYAGNDTLNGGGGNDILIGGLGDDIYYVDAAKDVVTEKANEGDDTVFSTTTYTLANNVENLTLYGFSEIHAAGNKTNNLVYGNSAANSINGGLGNDTLTGGLGNDTFVFNTKLGATNIDTITDFTNGDKIALAGSIFSKLKGNKDLSDNLYVQTIVGIPTRDDNVTNDYLFYDLESGQLYYDADGYGSGKDAVQIAIIGTGGISLTANDFSIV